MAAAAATNLLVAPATITSNGGSSNDKLYGGSGRDKLIGGSGNDYLNGGSSNDKLYGGSGATNLLVAPATIT